jgi:hypothetical protein
MPCSGLSTVANEVPCVWLTLFIAADLIKPSHEFSFTFAALGIYLIHLPIVEVWPQLVRFVASSAGAYPSLV